MFLHFTIYYNPTSTYAVFEYPEEMGYKIQNLQKSHSEKYYPHLSNSLVYHMISLSKDRHQDQMCL